jgi:hypothetical protein
VTSYCTITNVKIIKSNNVANYKLTDFIKISGNKTVFTTNELTNIYKQKKNVVLLEMIYNGFFGKGHNVTHKQLKDKGLFNTYPYSIEYSENEFKQILRMGDVDVQNVIID